MSTDNTQPISIDDLEEQATRDYVARTIWEIKKRGLPENPDRDFDKLVLLAQEKEENAIGAIVGYFFPMMNRYVSSYLSEFSDSISGPEMVTQVMNECYLSVIDAIEHFNIIEAHEKKIKFPQYVEACLQGRIVCLINNSKV